jgi:hypothetical protein
MGLKLSLNKIGFYAYEEVGIGIINVTPIIPISKPDYMSDEEWEQIASLIESNPSMTLEQLTILITDFIEVNNRKDGVKFTPKNGKHSFSCLKCGKIHIFKYDAMQCCKE